MASRVTAQPSSKTSYVVLGGDAGPSKLAAIQKHGLTTLDEDGFLNLIATRKGKLDPKAKEKQEKEEEKIRQAAKDIDKREKADAASKTGSSAKRYVRLLPVGRTAYQIH